jgi:hypothetical protein
MLVAVWYVVGLACVMGGWSLIRHVIHETVIECADDGVTFMTEEFELAREQRDLEWYYEELNKKRCRYLRWRRALRIVEPRWLCDLLGREHSWR